MCVWICQVRKLLTFEAVWIWLPFRDVMKKGGGEADGAVAEGRRHNTSPSGSIRQSLFECVDGVKTSCWIYGYWCDDNVLSWELKWMNYYCYKEPLFFVLILVALSMARIPSCCENLKFILSTPCPNFYFYLMTYSTPLSQNPTRWYIIYLFCGLYIVIHSYCVQTLSVDICVHN